MNTIKEFLKPNIFTTGIIVGLGLVLSIIVTVMTSGKIQTWYIDWGKDDFQKSMVQIWTIFVPVYFFVIAWAITSKTKRALKAIKVFLIAVFIPFILYFVFWGLNSLLFYGRNQLLNDLTPWNDGANLVGVFIPMYFAYIIILWLSATLLGVGLSLIISSSKRLKV